ncbi:dCTP deaminase [Ancylobacter sp. MQZ15Z-1]|uniref:dCTP deaminase n=1 Tax=Ancylobacter mangrovi TaxID=2972472 RepID=A0A9X2T0I3_9HYPH|nr:dCTP deaminase [Ancylobacter mangrovi]MCS0493865.1 dCTP deaminase [Ancylobacter mangrovi]
MILTDREIHLAILKKQIIIDPSPEEVAFSSTSLDLRLDENLRVFQEERLPSIRMMIDPSDPAHRINEVLRGLTSNVVIDAQDGYTLAPQKLVLGWTKEYVRLPDESRVAARVEGKSSLARLGLCVHMTAPTIHAGFKGNIQLEIVNFGPLPIILKPGLRVCQLIFETTLGTPAKGYGGQFAGQTS